MMSLDEREIEQVLKQFDRQTANRLRPILYANMIGGRTATYLMNHDHTLETYIHMVVANYRASSDYLHQLQVERAEDSWRVLLRQIQQWTFNLFLRKGLSKVEAEALAKETAENAALRILITLFPYDVPFEVWAMSMTLKQCYCTLSKMKGDKEKIQNR